MKLILPFNVEPSIKGYVHYAYPLGIIESNIIKSNNFILNNFIQMVWYESKEYTGFEFNFYMPFFLYWKNFKREHLKDDMLNYYNIDYEKFIKMGLHNKRYVYLCADEYYIPNRSRFNKEHRYHDIIIYGYDDESKEFYVAGYNEKDVYKESKCSYSLMCAASPKYIEFISIDENYKYELQRNKIKKDINDFIHPESMTIQEQKINGDKRIFGNKACMKLLDYLEYIIINNVKCNIIPFYIYWEHLNLMLKRAKHFNLKEDIIKKLICAENEADTLKYSLLKYNIQLDKQILYEVKNIIESCIELEDVSLNMMLSDL